MDHSKVTPYKSEKAKKEQVASMFNNIAGRYDFLNHFFSLGIDILWRRKAINLLRRFRPASVLDIATGTGDFAIEALKLNPQKVVGVDISEGMMAVGRKKLDQKGLSEKITLQYGDSEALPFEDASFDAITVGFGVRNFENLRNGLREINRVLSPAGAAAILEFSRPRKFPIKQLYRFYFKRIMPLAGKMISKDNSAYTYLPESVMAFPDGNDFAAILKEVGFKKVEQYPVTMGIATIYLAQK